MRSCRYPQLLQDTCNILGNPLKFDGKTLLLKTPHPCIIEHRDFELQLYWPALAGAMHVPAVAGNLVSGKNIGLAGHPHWETVAQIPWQ